MLESRARRIPLIDVDDDTKRPMIVNVVTQYRILKFVAVNVTETQSLRKPLRHLNLGTYEKLETARMETPVMDVIHQLVQHSISSVPILNSDGKQFSNSAALYSVLIWHRCRHQCFRGSGRHYTHQG